MGADQMRASAQPLWVHDLDIETYQPLVEDVSDNLAGRSNAPKWIGRMLLAELDGRLWHVADPVSWAGILQDQGIRHDATAKYAKSFCRTFGAISLFDLACSDHGVLPPASHWSAWLMPDSDLSCYWLEICREQIESGFLSHSDMLARWHEASERSLRMIEGVEAAHIGFIPLSSVVRVFELRRGSWMTTLYPASRPPTGSS